MKQLAIGPALEYVREQAAMSRKTLSERSGLRPMHIRKIERCATKCSIEHLVTLSTALGVEPWKLLKAVCKKAGRHPAVSSEEDDHA